MNTSSTCTRDNDRAAHAGFGDRISFTMTWSMVRVSIACEALHELSSVGLFRSGCKLQLMGKSQSFYRECIFISAGCRRTMCKACFGLFHWGWLVRRTHLLLPAAWGVHLLVLISQALWFFLLFRFSRALFCASLFLNSEVVRGKYLVRNTCRLL